MISVSRVELDNYFTRLYVWNNIPVGEVGEGIIIPRHADKSVHVKGTFGGATVNINGSNDIDGAQYDVLDDALGNALSVGTGDKKIRQILVNPYLIRPEIIGGDGTTNLTVTLVVRT